MSDTLKFGQIIEGEQHRDAVHVAVAPVVAGMKLVPGCHVGIDDAGKAWTSIAMTPIGVVDPFLSRAVQPGEKFWLFLYPGTIKSLRHEWEHPAFGPAKEPVSNPVQLAKARLEDIANRCGVSCERMMVAVSDDDYISMGENEGYRAILNENYAQFVADCSLVLGKEVKNPYPFSCSC